MIRSKPSPRSMTDIRPDNVPVPADDATVVAELAAMSKVDLRNFVDARIWFRDDAPPEIRRAFHARQRLAQEMLDHD